MSLQSENEKMHWESIIKRDNSYYKYITENTVYHGHSNDSTPLISLVAHPDLASVKFKYDIDIKKIDGNNIHYLIDHGIDIIELINITHVTDKSILSAKLYLGSEDNLLLLNEFKSTQFGLSNNKNDIFNMVGNPYNQYHLIVELCGDALKLLNCNHVEAKPKLEVTAYHLAIDIRRLCVNKKYMDNISYDELIVKLEKDKKIKDMMLLCPICNEKSEIICDCQYQDQSCKNNHKWHIENGMRINGHTH